MPSPTHQSAAPWLRLSPLAIGGALAAALVVAATVSAQGVGPSAIGTGDAPVTVDDSPTALLLLQRAEDQTAQNPADAIRALQEVLDEFGEKLVPRSAEEPDRLISARQGAQIILRRDPALLDRYRQVENVRARLMLEQGELEQLWRTRSLTESGLRAGLLLAEEAVEGARFELAAALIAALAEHPDAATLAGASIQIDRLRGIVAHATGDATAALAALDRLNADRSELARASAASLRRMIEGGIATARVGRGTLDEGIGPPPGPTSWHLIASAAMPESLYARLYEAIDEGGRLAMRGEDRPRLIGSLLTAAPTVRGHVVYVNEGSTVRAFDRLSGRTQWVTPIGGGGVGRDGSPPGDLSAVALVDDSLVTIDGHAHATERSSTARVTCLDPDSGAVRWATVIDRLAVGAEGAVADEVGNLAPHGAPVIVDGLVFVLARKVTPRFEIVSYVVALDLADGSLRWARHLCSAAGARLSGLRPHTSITAAAGVLYATLSTGAVARIDARSGEIQWLVRIPVPIRDPRFLSEPWELGAALPTSRGILTVAPDQRDVLLLDASTGRILERHPLDLAAPLGLARYLLATRSAAGRETVIAVGSDVVAFDLADLTTPLWALSQRQPTLGTDVELRSGVRGRVHVADGTVAIPTPTSVLVVDAGSGELLQEIAVSGPGNPVLFGPQLVLATHAAVECHMPFAAAEGLIRDRMRVEPDVPEHGLALLGLGLRAESFVTCLDGATATLASLERLPATAHSAERDRADLFRRLIDVDAARLAEAEDDGETLHALVARVAREPWQRTMQRLVHGDWLVRRSEFGQAVESWQEILDSAELSDAAVPLGDTRLAGASAARIRMAELVAAHGPDVVATHAEAAATEFAQLVSAGEPMQALLRLARRRSMTPAAAQAVLRAAETARDAGAPRLALDALLWGWREGIGPEIERPVIAGAAIALAIESRWWILANDLVSVAAGEGLVDADDWSGLIEEAGGSELPRPAQLGTVAGAGRELRGGLVPSAGGIDPLGFSDRVLIADGVDLVMLDTELSERWRTALPSTIDASGGAPASFAPASLELLIADRRGVLVSGRGAESARLTWLDADTGEIRWRSDEIESLLTSSAPRPRGERGDEPRDPGDRAAAIAVGDGVVLIRDDGTLAALSLDDGRTVEWALKSTLRRVTAVAVHDSAIVLAGVDAGGGGQVVVVVDPRTGVETTRHRPRTGSEVRWLNVSPLGLAFVGTEAGVDAIDIVAERTEAPVAWSVASDSLRGSVRGWATPRWLLVSDGLERLVALRLADGRVEPGRFGLPARIEPASLAIRDVLASRDGIAVLFDRRVVDYTHDGQIRGMDVATDDRSQRLLAVARGLLMPIGLVGSVQVEIAPGVHRTQHDHRIHLLDRDAGLRLVGPPLQVGSIGRPFERAATIDGWLMLSNGAATVAVPMTEP